jgi:hypothetical protein
MRNALFSIFVVGCVGALTWPGYAWFGNRIEPYVLGLPFSLAWVVGWVVLGFLVLAGYHLSGPSENHPGRPGDGPS